MENYIFVKTQQITKKKNLLKHTEKNKVQLYSSTEITHLRQKSIHSKPIKSLLYAYITHMKIKYYKSLTRQVRSTEKEI